MLYMLMIAIVAISCAQMDKGNERIVADQPAIKQVTNESLNISSGGLIFPAYLAAPTMEGKWPAVVMIHSFNGIEPGYITMADQFALQGSVVSRSIIAEFRAFPKGCHCSPAR